MLFESVIMVRTGRFGADFGHKLIMSLIGLGICIYDWKVNDRKDYFWVFLVGTLIWTLAEVWLQVVGTRILQDPDLFGLDVTDALWLTAPLQGMSEAGFVAAIGMVFGDRLLNKETRKNGIISFVIVLLFLMLSYIEYGIAFQDVPVGNPSIPSRRDMFPFSANLFVLLLSSIAISWLITMNSKGRKRGLSMYLIMVSFIAWWTLLEFLTGQRFIEIGTLNPDGTFSNLRRAPPLIEFAANAYCVLVEVSLIYVPFLGIPYWLGLIKPEVQDQSEKNYEKMRELLSSKISAPLPENKTSKKLITNLFPDEEGFLIANGIRHSFFPTSLLGIRMRTGFSRRKIKNMIEDMAEKGKILKFGPFVILPGYLPGLFEVYFTSSRDDPEHMKKAAEAHYKLLSSGFHAEHMANFPIYRVLPAAKPVEKQIEVNQSLEVKQDIFPHEIVKEYFKAFDVFGVQPCSCRTAAKLAGNPCQRTDENYCISAGALAKNLIKKGVARKVSYEELMEVLKRAEREGLIHGTSNMKKSSMFVCNCCPCCCGVFKQVKKYRDELNHEEFQKLLPERSFEPEIDKKCEKCELCADKCPMEVISYLEQEDRMHIELEYCIGCGVCAANCPNDAITLKKVKNVEYPKGLLGLGRNLMKN
ncbi:MAG: 4Fe-4S binding protein [Promethearchaeia archaeon]